MTLEERLKEYIAEKRNVMRTAKDSKERARKDENYKLAGMLHRIMDINEMVADDLEELLDKHNQTDPRGK